MVTSVREDKRRVTPATVASRYAAVRTLRTRAMGAPFRVRWEGSQLVITPMSGIDRHVGTDELRACWPHLDRAAPKSSWKHLTSNASYLEAIYDDLALLEEDDGQAGPRSPLVTSRVETLQGRVEELEQALGTADHRRHEAEAARDELQDQLRELQHRVAEGSRGDDGASDRDAVAALKVRLKMADQSLTLARQEADESETARLALEKQLRAVEKAALAAEGRLNEARREALDLKRRLDEDSAVPGHQDRDLSTLLLELAGYRDSLRDDLWESLERAATLAAEHPTASVAQSRMTLEAAINHLWREANNDQLVGRRVAEMLDDLRDSPLLPLNDWHLAKNLYSRASSVIHGQGPSRPDLAAWMYLGCLQFCQLVPR